MSDPLAPAAVTYTNHIGQLHSIQYPFVTCGMSVENLNSTICLKDMTCLKIPTPGLRRLLHHRSTIFTVTGDP
jgi:hypothetical protein